MKLVALGVLPLLAGYSFPRRDQNGCDLVGIEIAAPCVMGIPRLPEAAGAW